MVNVQDVGKISLLSIFMLVSKIWGLSQAKICLQPVAYVLKSKFNFVLMELFNLNIV